MNKLSIIVVSYDNLTELKKTIGSIDMQNSLDETNAEIIVVASGYTSEAFLKNNIMIMPMSIIFNKDTSLYNAMNIGIKHATGSHILFLNSGDEFFSSNTFLYLLSKLEKNKILIGKSIQYYKNDMYIRPSNYDLSLRKKISHQSFCAPISKNKILYDESITISADSKWMSSYLNLFESSTSLEIISKFELGGISNSLSLKKIILLCRKNDYKRALREIIKYISFFWISDRFRYRILAKKNNFIKIN